MSKHLLIAVMMIFALVSTAIALENLNADQLFKDSDENLIRSADFTFPEGMNSVLSDTNKTDAENQVFPSLLIFTR